MKDAAAEMGRATLNSSAIKIKSVIRGGVTEIDWFATILALDEIGCAMLEGAINARLRQLGAEPTRFKEIEQQPAENPAQEGPYDFKRYLQKREA